MSQLERPQSKKTAAFREVLDCGRASCRFSPFRHFNCHDSVPLISLKNLEGSSTKRVERSPDKPCSGEGESVPDCVKLDHFRPSTAAEAAAGATPIKKRDGIPRGPGLRLRQLPLFPPSVLH